MGTTAWKFSWIAIFLLVEVPSLLCLAGNDLQLISGCDCTYIEQPVSNLSCDPYLSGVTVKCAVIGLQDCSIELYTTGPQEVFIGYVTALVQEIVFIQSRSYKRHDFTITIDANYLIPGQEYGCQVRVGGELTQQSSTLLIESRDYYTSQNYTSCRNPQSVTVARCADADFLRPAAKHSLAILLPIWLCVLACILLLITIVVVDCKIKKNRNTTVTQHAPHQGIVHMNVTPVYELICDTNFSSTEQAANGASNYAPSDTECDIDNMLYSDACTTKPAAVATTDEDCTVYRRLDPESKNYISMYSKPSSARPLGNESKESEYQLIDRSKLDPENPYAIRNPPVKVMESEEGIYEPIDSSTPDPDSPYAIRNPTVKLMEAEEGIYEPINSSKLDPENPYAARTPPTKETKGPKAVYQLLDSSKLDPEHPYAIRNPLARVTGGGV